MPPEGGLADKIGNRYEGRIAILRILRLLDEQDQSVRIRYEKPGDDKFEWWVQLEDGSRTYAQVKRQHAFDREWTIKELVTRKVLTAFGQRLDEEPTARCEFNSMLSSSHLQQLSEDARMANSLGEFEARFVHAKDKNDSWTALRGAWADATPEEFQRAFTGPANRGVVMPYQPTGMGGFGFSVNWEKVPGDEDGYYGRSEPAFRCRVSHRSAVG